jgi:hypothetical protein
MIHAMLSGYHFCFIKPLGQDSNFVPPEYKGRLNDTPAVSVNFLTRVWFLGNLIILGCRIGEN